MAKVYIIECPVCGQEFEATKGILVSESGLDPIPEDRMEETPFCCPICGHTMSIGDEDFMDNVVSIMMVATKGFAVYKDWKVVEQYSVLSKDKQTPLHI